MELSQHTVFQSSFVTIRDIFRDGPPRATVEQALDNGSVLFIRYGLFTLSDRSGSMVLDANYALFGDGSKNMSVIGEEKGRCACTIVQYHDEEVINTLHGRGESKLCTPRAYLMQARLLNYAWLGRSTRSIDEAASLLLSEMVDFANSKRDSEIERSDTVRSIKALVNSRLSKPLSLAELGKTIYLSPFTISRIFHRETGVSLREYVRRLRLRTALSRILDGVQPTHVAGELGFYDESHFSKAFHAEFGSAPAFALGAACNDARR